MSTTPMLEAAGAAALQSGRTVDAVLQEWADGAGISVKKMLENDELVRQDTAQANARAQVQQMADLAIRAYEEGEASLHELRTQLESAGQGEAAGLLVSYAADDHRQTWGSDDDSYDQLDPIEYQQTYAQELAADRDRIAAELHDARVQKTAAEINEFGAKLQGAPPAVIALVRSQLEAELSTSGTVPEAAAQDAIIAQAQRSAAAADHHAAEIDAVAETTARILKNQHAGFGGEFQDRDKREAHVARQRLEAMQRVEFSAQELLPASTPEEEKARTIERLKETSGAGVRFQERAHEIRRAGLEGVDNPLAHIEQSTRDRGAARQRLREVDERAAAVVEPSEATKSFLGGVDRMEKHGGKDPNGQLDEFGGAFG